MAEKSFKVRIVLPAAVIHVLSSTEPKIVLAKTRVGIAGLDLDSILDGDGDTLGYIDWSFVQAVSWRREATAKPAKATKRGRPKATMKPKRGRQILGTGQLGGTYERQQ